MLITYIDPGSLVNGASITVTEHNLLDIFMFIHHTIVSPIPGVIFRIKVSVSLC